MLFCSTIFDHTLSARFCASPKTLSNGCILSPSQRHPQQDGTTTATYLKMNAGSSLLPGEDCFVDDIPPLAAATPRAVGAAFALVTVLAALFNY